MATAIARFGLSRGALESCSEPQVPFWEVAAC